ncbi:MAG: hypothetical protein AAF358_13565 [Pseudomonadota bacterium]
MIAIPDVQYIMPGLQATLIDPHRVAYDQPHASAVMFLKASTAIRYDYLIESLGMYKMFTSTHRSGDGRQHAVEAVDCIIEFFQETQRRERKRVND